MAEHDWRKSSFSGSEANCVEVGRAARAVLIRDTKDRDGFTLTVPSEAWGMFTADLK
jgi:hypothetical protein